MRVPDKVGLTSFACGAFAVLLAFSATYAYAIRDWGNWFVFDLIEHFGLLKQNSHIQAEAKSFTIFSINEANAITWTFFMAIALVVVSIFAALRAEAKYENTLYLSGGFICAALSVMLIDRWWGIATLISGFIALLLVRARCQEP